MRRSILIVMLDVMVLSVLALTARQRPGSGNMVNIPIPASGISQLISEGLRNEASFRDEISRLEVQLAASAEVARKALEQVALSEARSGRERSENEKMLAQVRETELAVERARAAAALATRETELVNAQAALAKERMLELEQREAEARARTQEVERRELAAKASADEALAREAEAKERAHELELRELEAKTEADNALARVLAAEKKAQEAAQLAEDAERSEEQKDSEVLALRQEMLLARSAQKLAESRTEKLALTVESQEQELLLARTAEAAAKAQVQVETAERERLAVKTELVAEELLTARSAEATARATAQVASTERERLVVKTEQVVEELVQARESVAVMQEREKGDAEKIAQFKEEKRVVVEEQSKSVWVRRDEALRRLSISYTEFDSLSGRYVQTNKELAMPLVKTDRFELVPAEFKSLGLKRSFFGGLSDQVTDVSGVVAPMVGVAKPGSLSAIIVPVAEPQVCLVHSVGHSEGALVPITMLGLKEQRLQSALLFSAEDVNAYGQVEISPLVGRDYLNVRPLSGKKPKVGDYLLTERGEFVGVMVESDVCSVLSNKLSSSPKPIIIPLTERNEKGLYWSEFVKNLNMARELFQTHLDTRKF